MWSYICMIIAIDKLAAYYYRPFALTLTCHHVRMCACLSGPAMFIADIRFTGCSAEERSPYPGRWPLLPVVKPKWAYFQTKPKWWSSLKPRRVLYKPGVLSVALSLQPFNRSDCSKCKRHHIWTLPYIIAWLVQRLCIKCAPGPRVQRARPQLEIAVSNKSDLCRSLTEGLPADLCVIEQGRTWYI